MCPSYQKVELKVVYFALIIRACSGSPVSLTVHSASHWMRDEQTVLTDIFQWPHIQPIDNTFGLGFVAGQYHYHILEFILTNYFHAKSPNVSTLYPEKSLLFKTSRVKDLSSNGFLFQISIHLSIFSCIYTLNVAQGLSAQANFLQLI